MGQQPRSVSDINVTVGPWVITSAVGQVATPEQGMTGNAWEPEAFGLYQDRDGDIWEKDARGWRLRLQDGVSVDPDTVWEWTDGCVCEYAPFTPWG
ncbi:hypothetical protein AB0N05_04065 [Nocardia sp. NPDC051030]|uniref:hypothetical protein n=1 Tax=Nocardia sp. NPDC051030 TaxID=3155162 RepID=UPI003431D23E